MSGDAHLEDDAATLAEREAPTAATIPGSAEASAAAAMAEPSRSAPRAARQWVVIRGGSMDLRVGEAILPELADVLRSSAGRPHSCALVHEASVAGDVVRTLHDNLCAAGFSVQVAPVDFGRCDLEAVSRLAALLAEMRVTSDDVVLAVGGAETLSVASYLCSSWCGGVPLAEVPLDLASAMTSAVTPRALDAGDRPRMLSQDATAKFMTIDLDLVAADPASDEARLAYAYMAQTAMCDSDRSFGQLWDAAEDLVAGDRPALVEQLKASVKSRGKVSSATSAALRQSLEFGETFARALRSLAPEVDAATALADGMRFATRLGVVLEGLSVDDMLAVDELLERLGLGTTRASVDPEALVSCIRDERLARTNRFMLAVPRALGRVRLSVMTDETILEHASAWCASRLA